MNRVAVPSSFVFSAGNDCKDCMHQWVKNCGTDLDRLHDTPAVVWLYYIAHFTKEVGPDFYGLDKPPMANIVYHSRERTFGDNTISKVESHYSGTNDMAFLCYSATFAGEKKMQCMICFLISQLLNLLLYPMIRMLLQCRSLHSAQE